jgi:hypothetical protein
VQYRRVMMPRILRVQSAPHPGWQTVESVTLDRGEEQLTSVRNRSLTADSRITRRIGRLSAAKVQVVVSKVILLITA